MNIDVIYSPSDKQVALVTDGLRSYNRPHLEDIQSEQILFLLREADDVIAGCSGRLFGQWFCIQYLWVDEKLRGTGVGSQLMTATENHIIEKGCKKVLVDTLSFQALPFYKKLGFEERMTLDDYPIPDMKIYFLVKTLDA
ncbi:GNAT family N-acetyltransferase [Veronia pacifica]|uniref:N-acetyltransferase domain-containing protein n=1 Tax=Veronia pacifica TaxID=1080227 RepID=A0A1C3EKZ2_9GAMM|nr:GNAT family N-acetyltransferase [Veronia pacifica]ODA33899.1 hypothetical protein A8L45_08770 [Veronia pacifica]